MARLASKIGLDWIGCSWALSIAKTVDLVVVGVRGGAFPGVEVEAGNIVVVGGLGSDIGDVVDGEVKLDVISHGE